MNDLKIHMMEWMFALKRLFSLVSLLLALFTLSSNVFADEYATQVFLSPGSSSKTSGKIYLQSGYKMKINVNSYSGHKVYYKVFSQSTGKIIKDGYVASGKSTALDNIGGPVGYYQIMLKCTTGSAVYKDCDAEGYLSAHY
ncbi:hypothetical protein [Shimazuella kribbensis]|uniref:hypothetical protein n=1 Tax=Shimazuella kribbensis TaxID=139808 RepID=UPI00048FDAD6|nr:hypothetical protein [Shimazuella kribbensis]